MATPRRADRVSRLDRPRRASAASVSVEKGKPRPADAPPRARLFVALDLPDDARETLVEWQQQALAARTDLRAVAPDALHITLAFLGYRPEAEIEPIAATVAHAAGPLHPARLTPLATKPVPRRRPRLFALDLDDPEHGAEAVHKAIAEALASGGFYEAEKRAFWPHVTVARVNRGARHPAPVTVPPPTAAFTATDVTLYRSHLGRGPARYESLHRTRLA